MLISAVVCTRDRSDMAVRAIKSLIGQSADPVEYEILVVDNGSTDDTEKKVRALADETSRVEVRYVEEPRTGIAHARNTGYENARGEYVAFIDDDAAAEPDWLERVIRNVRSAEEPLLALGGRILPLYEVPKPGWFLDRYEARTHGVSRRFLRPDESFSASNMVVLRQAFIDVGGFPTDVGMSGERLMVGEEPLVFERFWESLPCKGRILYDPEMKVRHSVPAKKMRVLTCARRQIAMGQFNAFVLKQSGELRFVLAVRALASMVVRSFVALFLVFRTGNLKRWVYEGLGEVAEPFGRFLALVGIEPKVKRV